MDPIVPLDRKTNDELTKDFSNGHLDVIQVGPEKWMYQKDFLKYADKYRNFKVRESDVWICGFPRSGTTMTSELIWLLTHNLDFERARKLQKFEKVPLFEINCLNTEAQRNNLLKSGVDPKVVEAMKNLDESQFDRLEADTETRVLKAHSPFTLLPANLLTSGAKVIFLARYVKDVIVSYYYLLQLMAGRSFNASFEKFYTYFENNLLNFNPYWDHLKQGYEHRNHENVLFIFYEDIRSDYRAGFKKIADFLGKDLTEKQMDDLVNYMQFDNFKKSDCFDSTKPKKNGMFVDIKGNEFIRKGKCGGWKDHFTEELSKRADKWIEANLKRINFEYPEYIRKLNEY